MVIIMAGTDQHPTPHKRNSKGISHLCRKQHGRIATMASAALLALLPLAYAANGSLEKSIAKRYA